MIALQSTMHGPGAPRGSAGTNLWPTRDCHNEEVWSLLENGVNVSLTLEKGDGVRVVYRLVPVVECTLCHCLEQVGTRSACPACGVRLPTPEAEVAT